MTGLCKLYCIIWLDIDFGLMEFPFQLEIIKKPRLSTLRRRFSRFSPFRHTRRIKAQGILRKQWSKLKFVLIITVLPDDYKIKELIGWFRWSSKYRSDNNLGSGVVLLLNLFTTNQSMLGREWNGKWWCITMGRSLFFSAATCFASAWSHLPSESCPP
jgi:hypothetical protein